MRANIGVGNTGRRTRARRVAFARRCTVCIRGGRANNLGEGNKYRNTPRGKNDRNTRAQRRLPHASSALYGTHAGGERDTETLVAGNNDLNTRRRKNDRNTRRRKNDRNTR